MLKIKKIISLIMVITLALSVVIPIIAFAEWQETDDVVEGPPPAPVDENEEWRLDGTETREVPSGEDVVIGTRDGDEIMEGTGEYEQVWEDYEERVLREKVEISEDDFNEDDTDAEKVVSYGEGEWDAYKQAKEDHQKLVDKFEEDQKRFENAENALRTPNQALNPSIIVKAPAGVNVAVTDRNSGNDLRDFTTHGGDGGNFAKGIDWDINGGGSNAWAIRVDPRVEGFIPGIYMFAVKAGGDTEIFLVDLTNVTGPIVLLLGEAQNGANQIGFAESNPILPGVDPGDFEGTKPVANVSWWRSLFDTGRYVDGDEIMRGTGTYYQENVYGPGTTTVIIEFFRRFVWVEPTTGTPTPPADIPPPPVFLVTPPAVVPPVLPLVALPPAPVVDEPADEVVIPDAPTPLAPAPVVPIVGPGDDDSDEIVIIGDADVPLAGPTVGGHWALWNLILSISGALLAVIMIAKAIAKKKRNEDEEKEEDEEQEKTKRNRLIMLLAAPILAVLAIIIFILTQDMTQPMILVDFWTLAHAIIFGGGLLSYIFQIKQEKDEDEDEDELAAAGA